MKYRKRGVAGMKKEGLKRDELGEKRRMEVKTEGDRSRRKGKGRGKGRGVKKKELKEVEEEMKERKRG